MPSASLTVRTCLLCGRLISADPTKPDPARRAQVLPIQGFTVSQLEWLAEHLSDCLVVNPERPA